MLFRVQLDGEAVRPTPPQIAAPPGELVTSVEAGALDTRRSLPDQQAVLPGGVEWRRWSTDAVVAELLLGPIAPVLPPDMAVQGCAAATWRVQAHGHVSGLALSCCWSCLPPGADGGPDAGEGLDALTWWVDGVVLSVGTEDGEYLARTARRGLSMPVRLMPECHIATVHYQDNGLVVPFAALEAAEVVQVHFIVAWAALEDPKRCDTWFAVDQSPEEILRQLGADLGPGDGACAPSW